MQPEEVGRIEPFDVAEILELAVFGNQDNLEEEITEV